MNKLLFVALVAILSRYDAQAQSDAWSNPSLQELYGDIKHGPSKSLNPLANLSMILPDTKAEEWPGIRANILKRVSACFGTGPAELRPAVNQFQEIERYQNFGLTHIRYRYQIVDSLWSEAVLVLPEHLNNGQASACFSYSRN